MHSHTLLYETKEKEGRGKYRGKRIARKKGMRGYGQAGERNGFGDMRKEGDRAKNGDLMKSRIQRGGKRGRD